MQKRKRNSNLPGQFTAFIPFYLIFETTIMPSAGQYSEFERGGDLSPEKCWKNKTKQTTTTTTTKTGKWKCTHFVFVRFFEI